MLFAKFLTTGLAKNMHGYELWSPCPLASLGTGSLQSILQIRSSSTCYETKWMEGSPHRHQRPSMASLNLSKYWKFFSSLLLTSWQTCFFILNRQFSLLLLLPSECPVCCKHESEWCQNLVGIQLNFAFMLVGLPVEASSNFSIAIWSFSMSCFVPTTDQGKSLFLKFFMTSHRGYCCVNHRSMTARCCCCTIPIQVLQ